MLNQAKRSLLVKMMMMMVPEEKEDNVESKVSNPAARDWRGRNRKKAARTLKNNGEGTDFGTF